MMALHKLYEILYYDCFHMDNLIDHRRSGVEVVVDVALNERNTRLEFFIFSRTFSYSYSTQIIFYRI